MAFFGSSSVSTPSDVLGVGLGFVHVLAQAEGARNSAVIAFAAQHLAAVALRFLLVLDFGIDLHDVAVDAHVDVFLLDAGDVGLDDVGVFLFRNVQSHVQSLDIRIETRG